MSAATIPVHARNLNPRLTELCHSGWSCEIAALLSELWLLVTVGILTIIVLAALANLRAASNRIEEERSRTGAERDAFQAFAKRVENISPDTVQATPGTDGSAVATTTAVANQSRQLEKVREAYRETVMAVPHYDEEYGESLVENLTVELGEDIAASVGGNQQLSPMLQQALITKSMNAVAERDRLMGWLSDETEALDIAREALTDIDSELVDYTQEHLRNVELNGLGTRYDRLDMLENRCQEVAQTRQRTLHNQEVHRHGGGQRFMDFLYDPLEVSHPVLADVTAVFERIHAARRTVARAAMQRA